MEEGPDMDASRDDGSGEEVELANQGGEAPERESALLVCTKHLKDLVAKRADLGRGHPELHQRCVDLDTQKLERARWLGGIFFGWIE